MNQEEQVRELDRILKLWAESYNVNKPLELHGCQHQIQYYNGFREEYEFCTKCDAKKINGLWVEHPSQN